VAQNKGGNRVKLQALLRGMLSVVALLFATLAVAEQEECTEPKNHCTALTLFEQATKANREGQWRQAATLAIQAIGNVPVDALLEHKVLCLSLEDEGYVSDIVFVPCQRFSPYSPNALLSLIKNDHPPKPYVFVGFAQQNGLLQDHNVVNGGWQVNDYQQHEGQISRFVVGNAGETALTGVYLILTDATGNQINQSTAYINAQSHWQQALTQATGVAFTRPFTVNLSEKDGFGFGQDNREASTVEDR
jgi:hypothetical protein